MARQNSGPRGIDACTPRPAPARGRDDPRRAMFLRTMALPSMAPMRRAGRLPTAAMPTAAMPAPLVAGLDAPPARRRPAMRDDAANAAGTTAAGDFDAGTPGDAPIIHVRGLRNTFGEQVVHDGLTWTCAAARSSAWSAVPARANRC